MRPRAERTERRRSADGGPGYGAALVVTLVIALLVGGAWWFAHDRASGRIAPGTTVAGVAVGGMDRTDAVAALRAGLARRATTPITVEVAGRRVAVDPVAAGLRVDYPASVERATVSNSWDPTQLWDYFTGGGDLDPVVTVDPARLDAEVASLTGRLGRPGRDGAVRLDGGRVRVVRAADSESLEPDQVRDALLHAYLSDDSLAQVALTATAPAVGDQAVRTAVDRLVNPALTAPVTLKFAGSRVVLRPPTFADALTLVPRGGALALDVDQARLMQLVRSTAHRASIPVDATVRIVDGAPRVVGGRPGLVFRPDTVAHTFLSLLGRPDDQRHAAVPSSASAPSFTAADARALGIVHPVASITTHFDAAQESYPVIARQAAAVDGTVLRPGATFSLAGAEPGGGDLTQLASTLYSAAFYAGLRDVEHTPPTPHVDRFPLGFEATVRPGGPDLAFQDTTPYGVLIQVSATRGSLTATLWSSSTWNVTSITSCARAAGSSAYEVVNSRVFKKPGSTSVDHVEKVVTEYPTLSPGQCRNAG